MTEVTVYECDGCGVRVGHTTELWAVPVRVPRVPNGAYKQPIDHTYHLCLDCGTTSISDVTDTWERFLLDGVRGEVIGLVDEDENVTELADLNVDDHGNVAIINEAIDAINEEIAKS